MRPFMWRSEHLTNLFSQLDRKCKRRLSQRSESMMITRRGGPPSERKAPDDAPQFALIWGHGENFQSTHLKFSKHSQPPLCSLVGLICRKEMLVFQSLKFHTQGSYTFDLSKFHDFFHDLLKYSMTWVKILFSSSSVKTMKNHSFFLGLYLL